MISISSSSAGSTTSTGFGRTCCTGVVAGAVEVGVLVTGLTGVLACVLFSCPVVEMVDCVVGVASVLLVVAGFGVFGFSALFGIALFGCGVAALFTMSNSSTSVLSSVAALWILLSFSLSLGASFIVPSLTCIFFWVYSRRSCPS